MKAIPFLGAFTLLLPLVQASAPQKQSDLELLQGTWECVATVMDGKAVDKYLGVRAILQGKKLTWLFPKGDGTFQTQTATFTIDPGKYPKHFDWSPDGKSEVHKRLYTLDGDTLKWSTNLGLKPRPEKWEDGRWQFSMKRVRNP